MSAYTVDLPLVINEPPPNQNDNLDDIFGSDDEAPPRSNEEWSDIPRLQEKHETEGYRDGVTQGKSETVQKGFDEGYNLGAVLGLKIGRILGLLEGLLAAVKTLEELGAETERLSALLAESKEDLGTKSVFAPKWWGEDGIWKFEVPGDEVLFPDVAAAHPLVMKWEKVIQAEVQKWGLDLEIMGTEDEHEGGEMLAPSVNGKTNTPVGVTKGLDW